MPLRLCPECSEAECLPRKRKCEECWTADQPITYRQPAAAARLELIPSHLRKMRVPEREWPQGRRWCSGCQTFVRLRDCSRTGSRCSTCTTQARFETDIATKYGITPDDWNQLMNVQGGRCAICRNPPKKKRLSVDHDHTTGAVRGLLCSRCNDELLGACYHKVEVLENAMRYLTEPPMAGNWVMPETARGEPEPAPF